MNFHQILHKNFFLSNLLNTFLIIHDITILLYDCCTKVIHIYKEIPFDIINTEDIEQLQGFQHFDWNIEEMLMNLQK